MHTQSSLLQSLARQGILPLFYHDDAEVCLTRLRSLYNAGIRLIEFTNRGPHAYANFQAMYAVSKNDFPSLQIGVGTIYAVQEAEQFINAGANFIVSPVFSLELANYCSSKEVLYIPGCMTPTEIYTAANAGIKLLKIFPAHLLGASYIKSIRELFPSLHFMPTGGITTNAESLLSWFRAGVIAVGIGGPLFQNADDPALLTKKIEEVIQAIRTIKTDTP